MNTHTLEINKYIFFFKERLILARGFRGLSPCLPIGEEETQGRSWQRSCSTQGGQEVRRKWRWVPICPSGDTEVGRCDAWGSAVTAQLLISLYIRRPRESNGKQAGLCGGCRQPQRMLEIARFLGARVPAVMSL